MDKLVGAAGVGQRPVTCLCPCRVCPGRLRRACGRCHAACQVGPRTRRAGRLRNRCHSPDRRNSPPGMVGVGCSVGSRPAPPRVHALAPPPPCWSGCPPRSGRGQPDEGPEQRAYHDQELAATAKRSVHVASKLEPTLSRLPSPEERKPRRSQELIVAAGPDPPSRMRAGRPAGSDSLEHQLLRTHS